MMATHCYSFKNYQGVKDVVVHVTDVNDNAPVFSPSHVTASVTEGPGTRGKVVIQVNATDVDEENNQLITYTIIDGNLGDAFKIDSSKVKNLLPRALLSLWYYF